MVDTGHAGSSVRRSRRFWAGRWRAGRWAVGVLATLVLVLLNLGPAATPAVVEENQVAKGRQLYQDNCAKCHGKFLEGQGGTARLAGSGSRVRQNYQNAQDLYNFISTAMPMDRPGALKPDEYWSLVAFLWSANGMDPGAVVVGPDNAAQLTWSSRPSAAAAPAVPPSTGGGGSGGAGGTGTVWAGAAGAVLVIGALGVAVVRRRHGGSRKKPIDPPAQG